MLTSDESQSMDECIVELMETLKKNKIHIGMGSMSLLLVTYAQTCGDSLEKFLNKMTQCWEILEYENEIQREENG